MKKAARLAVLTGVLASACWFSAQAQANLVAQCVDNAPCTTSVDCSAGRSRGFCSSAPDQ